jgi:hypothetical protein
MAAIKAAMFPKINAVTIDPSITISAAYTIYIVSIGIISDPSNNKIP